MTLKSAPLVGVYLGVVAAEPSIKAQSCTSSQAPPDMSAVQLESFALALTNAIHEYKASDEVSVAGISVPVRRLAKVGLAIEQF